MASFDLETFLKVQGETGTGAFQALGMSFGVPSCMLNLASAALNLLPSDVLGDMSDKIAEGKNAANDKMKEVFAKLTRDSGLIEFVTESGTIKFFGKGWNEIDNDGSQALDNLTGASGS